MDILQQGQEAMDEMKLSDSASLRRAVPGSAAVGITSVKNRKPPVPSQRFLTCTNLMRRAYLFLLWLIKKHEMHGYEIIKVLKKDGMNPMGAGRLYPLLGHMLANGLISQRQKKQGRRIKKIYVLTKKGEQALTGGKKLFKGLVGQFLKEMMR